MTKKMLVENPGLEFALVQIFGKLGDKAQPPTDVEHAHSGPGNNLSGGVESRHATFESVEVSQTGLANPRSTGECLELTSGSSAPPAQNSQFVPIFHEIVISTTRFGTNGEPVELQLECCIKNTREEGWTALPEGNVVETKGDFHQGEVLQLTLEEMEKAVVEGEADYLNDEREEALDYYLHGEGVL